MEGTMNLDPSQFGPWVAIPFVLAVSACFACIVPHALRNAGELPIFPVLLLIGLLGGMMAASYTPKHDEWTAFKAAHNCKVIAKRDGHSNDGIGLLLFLLALPALFVFLLFRFVADVTDYFGFWLFPGVFGRAMGLNLSMVAPSDPDVPFESLLQVVAGFETPSVLFVVGITSLLVPPACSLFKRLFPAREKAK